MADLESGPSSTDVGVEDAGPSTSTSHAELIDQESTSADSSFGEGENEWTGSMDVQSDDIGDQSDDMLLAEGDYFGNGSQPRVKLYELRSDNWFDCGTGYCRGIFDPKDGVNKIVVEREPMEDEVESAGGVYLLCTPVDPDMKCQDATMIVWQDAASDQNLALSFQEESGRDSIFEFIEEVQKHLDNQIAMTPMPVPREEIQIVPATPIPASPIFGMCAAPSLGNIKEQEMAFRMQAKTIHGRERAVEHIIGEDYIKQLIGVLHQAEDLESIADLHALCSMMQTILMFNDNSIFEYILQEDIYLGVLGMLEYDPEFPTLKASYRAFYRQFSKYRHVVNIKDEVIRHKIHQTSRLIYLKDVVLARMLDDPTFHILNSFVNFNQVDITLYIQQDDALLQQLFTDFRPEAVSDSTKDEKRRDLVLFLHQLMMMGKSIQLTHRLQLYRILIERGLLFACEWAFSQAAATILHAGAEMLTLVVEHDPNSVRLHVVRVDGPQRRPSLLNTTIQLLQTTSDSGLVVQLIDAIKALLEPGVENDGQAFARVKDPSLIESFIAHFYEHCATSFFAPLMELPESKALDGPPAVPQGRAALINGMVDTLSYCLLVHGHRAQYYILSNPLAQKVCSLLYASDKTLRYAALRFVKTCLHTNNHFIHRNFAKNGVTKGLLDIVERETDRDTMLSSACVDALELIRKDNMKAIISDMFDKYEPVMIRLAERPFVRACVLGLRARWDQNREPPPQPTLQAADSNQARTAAEEEEAWFNRSDEEGTSGSNVVPVKRKRPQQKRKSPAKGALGLDYDESDSEGSVEGDSPKVTETTQLAEDLTDVELKIRAKRQRAEQEEEEDGAMAGLLGKPGAVGRKLRGEKSEQKSEQKGDEGEAAGGSNQVKDKKIRLSLTGLGKKLGRT